MKKDVLLIANYWHFEFEKKSSRYRTMADVLCDGGYDVEVVSSSFRHQNKTQRDLEFIKTIDSAYKMTLLKEPDYKKNISLQRIYSHHCFAKEVVKYLESRKKPDLIICSVPSLPVGSAVTKFANANDIKVIIDIQDLWPEAFKMALNIPVISDILFSPMMIQANKIYSRADKVMAVSQTYVDRALKVNKSCKATQAVYIGINLPVFDENVKNNPYPKSDKITLAYCGSLSKSYDIRLVIDALALMENPPHFLVMGGGNDLEALKLYAEEKNVDVTFAGFLPYEEMCGMLCSCDITINPILGSSVASIINKHGDYAACGLPVINTQNSEEYCGLVKDYNMGFNCVGQGAEALAQKIKILCEDENLRKEMGENARRCAEEKFNRINTYPKIVKLIKEL